MNEQIREIWIDALTSGEYKQCKGMLRDGEGWCCLGVLSDLYIKMTGKAKWNGIEMVECKKYPENSSSILIEPIRRWAGMISYNGKYDTNSLSSDNDSGKSFMEIAEIIFENF